MVWKWQSSVHGERFSGWMRVSDGPDDVFYRLKKYVVIQFKVVNTWEVFGDYCIASIRFRDDNII